MRIKGRKEGKRKREDRKERGIGRREKESM